MPSMTPPDPDAALPAAAGRKQNRLLNGCLALVATGATLTTAGVVLLTSRVRDWARPDSTVTRPSATPTPLGNPPVISVPVTSVTVPTPEPSPAAQPDTSLTSSPTPDNASAAAADATADGVEAETGIAAKGEAAGPALPQLSDNGRRPGADRPTGLEPGILTSEEEAILRALHYRSATGKVEMGVGVFLDLKPGNRRSAIEENIKRDRKDRNQDIGAVRDRLAALEADRLSEAEYRDIAASQAAHLPSRTKLFIDRMVENYYRNDLEDEEVRGRANHLLRKGLDRLVSAEIRRREDALNVPDIARRMATVEAGVIIGMHYQVEQAFRNREQTLGQEQQR